MELQVSEKDGVTLLKLSGRLDTAGASEIETKFTGHAVPPGRPAVVDLSDVSFIASLGVRLLFSAGRALARANAKMAVFGAAGPVADVLRIVALDQIIPIASSEAEAVQLVRAG
jgi:anti-anti-sigma factor